MAYSSIPLRPGVTEHILNWIAPSKCVHADAWLYELTDSRLVFHLQYRTGGRDLFFDEYYYPSMDSDGSVSLVNAGNVDTWGAPTRTINGRWIAGHVNPAMRGMLNAVHWGAIYPKLAELRGRFARHSFLLHYIRAPALDPIADPASNQYEFTARAERDEKNRLSQRARYERYKKGLPPLPPKPFGAKMIEAKKAKRTLRFCQAMIDGQPYALSIVRDPLLQRSGEQNLKIDVQRENDASGYESTLER